MKLTINSKDLLKALQTVGSVINYNHSLPILQNFLFEVSGSLKITATDLDTTLSCVIEATGDGFLCLPAKMLTDTLKALPDQPITLERKDNIVLLIAKSGKYKLPCSDAAEFPKPVVISKSLKLEISADTLAEGINKTVSFSANDPLRPVIESVLFRVENNKITFASTDMHRLSVYSTTGVTGVESRDFIVHKKSLNILKNILVSGDLVIEYNDVNAKFIFDNMQFTTRLVDGKYPNYDAVVPKDNPIKVTVSRLHILNSAKRVSIFSNTTSKQIVLDISLGNIRITANDEGKSTDAEEDIKCESNDSIRIGFNHRFFIEIISSMHCDNILIELSQPKRGAVITPLDGLDETESSMLMVMPLAI